MDPTQEAGLEAVKGQQRQWEEVFAEEPDLYGTEPSVPARKAAGLFARGEESRILELGGGQGRDSLYFAGQGFRVHVLDYAAKGLEAIRAKAEASGLAARVATACHDIRLPLPFGDNAFDGCYSHMLYCMALTTAELVDLSGEVLRVLKPGGYHVFTVRNTSDAHFGKGIHRGEDIYEMGGFAVHFFSREKVHHLSAGFDVVAVEEFTEGALPRVLFQVTLRKPPGRP